MTAMMIDAALRGLALAAIVGLGLSALRVTNIPVRKAAWTLVLIASLAMPALMRWPAMAGLQGKFAWVLPIERSRVVAPLQEVAAPQIVPVLVAPKPTRDTADKGAYSASSEPAAFDGLSAADVTVTATPVANSVARHTVQWPPLAKMIVGLYLAVCGALLLRLLFGLAAALRLWTSALEVSPLDAPEPHVRASENIGSPVTIGSGVVLPAAYKQWDRKKLRMVLAHERSHVRQQDFYLQLLAGIYTAFFWFSPLGWWLRRTLSSLGEAISDRAGMNAAASPTGYAQVVLEFAALPHRPLPGVAMACSGNLSRRVESMLNENHLRRAFAEGRRRALASLLLIPLALFAVTALVRVPSAAAQTAPPASQSAPRAIPPAAADAPRTGVSTPPESQVTTTGAPAQDQPTPQAPQTPPPPAPAAAPQAAPPQAPPAPGSEPVLPAVAPLAPLDNVAPMPPEPPLAALPPNLDGHAATALLSNGNAVTVHEPHSFFIFSDGAAASGFGFHFSQNGDSYAVVQGPGNQFTFSGNWSGNFAAEIDKARKMTNGPFLWFHHDGKSYIVTDPAIVAQIESLYAPMQELGMRQKLLGQTQENLGKEQAAMAQAMKEARNISVPDVSKVMAQVQAEIKAEQSEWNDKIRAEVDSELKAAQSELSPEKMAALQADMKAYQSELSPEKMAEMQAKLKAAESQLSSAKMAELQATLKAEEDRWNAQNMAEMQARLAEMQARLGAVQAELSARQGEFGSRMGELGEQQGRLGDEQGRLGAQQGKMAQELDQQVQKIIQDTLQNGKAQPVH